MTVEYQHDAVPVNPTVVNAAYNFNIHTASCFPQKEKHSNLGQKSTKRKASSLECQYRCPKRAKRTTQISQAGDDTVSWYSWYGTSENVLLQEINLKRHSYDAFQNEYCQAVSESKLCCNSNVSRIMLGPTGSTASNTTTNQHKKKMLQSMRK